MVRDLRARLPLMHYPVLITKDRRSDYGVIVPDLPGCITAGRTIDEALDMAREAIELHLEGLIEHGSVPPLPRSIETLRMKREFTSGTWAIVHVDQQSLRLRVARIGITMPQRLLDAIDRHARKSGETRSGLLARAAIRYIGRDGSDLPTADAGGVRARRIRGAGSAARTASASTGRRQ
jgi:predicted RNase H-like HicB family nuclease